MSSGVPSSTEVGIGLAVTGMSRESMGPAV